MVEIGLWMIKIGGAILYICLTMAVAGISWQVSLKKGPTGLLFIPLASLTLMLIGGAFWLLGRKN